MHVGLSQNITEMLVDGLLGYNEHRNGWRVTTKNHMGQFTVGVISYLVDRPGQTT